MSVDMLTATIAPAGRVKTTDDPLVDFLILVLDGLQPAERRAEWLNHNMPKTAAWLSAHTAWERLTVVDSA